MTKPIAALALLILATGGGAYFTLRNLKEAGNESCVLSIEYSFGEALMRDIGLSRKIPITTEWRTLGEEEERIVFDKFIAENRTFDCKQFSEYANGEAFTRDHGGINVRREGELVRVRIIVDDARTRRF